MKLSLYTSTLKSSMESNVPIHISIFFFVIRGMVEVVLRCKVKEVFIIKWRTTFHKQYQEEEQAMSEQQLMLSLHLPLIFSHSYLITRKHAFRDEHFAVVYVKPPLNTTFPMVIMTIYKNAPNYIHLVAVFINILR